MTRAAIVVAALTATAAVACGSPGPAIDGVAVADRNPLAGRRVSAAFEGCKLGDAETALMGSQARSVEVLLLCLHAGADGKIAQAEIDDASASLAALHALGVRANIGLSFVDESGAPADVGAVARTVAHEPARGALLAALTPLLTAFDGFELDLRSVKTELRPEVDDFIAETGGMVHAQGKSLGLFVTASLPFSLDPHGGAKVDRVRVLTIEPEWSPGPSIEAGWAVDTLRAASESFPESAIDLSIADYAVDYGAYESKRLSIEEAQALLLATGAKLQRDETTGAAYIDYGLDTGMPHEVWIEDVTAIKRVLHLVRPPVLDGSVGVVIYGLGDEDPALWSSILL